MKLTLLFFSYFAIVDLYKLMAHIVVVIVVVVVVVIIIISISLNIILTIIR